MGEKLEKLFATGGTRAATIVITGAAEHRATTRLRGYPDGNLLLPRRSPSPINRAKLVWTAPPIAVTEPIQIDLSSEAHGRGLIPRDGWASIAFVRADGLSTPALHIRNEWAYPGDDGAWYYHWWDFRGVAEASADTYTGVVRALEIPGAEFRVSIAIGRTVPLVATEPIRITRPSDADR